MSEKRGTQEVPLAGHEEELGAPMLEAQEALALRASEFETETDAWLDTCQQAFGVEDETLHSVLETSGIGTKLATLRQKAGNIARAATLGAALLGPGAPPADASTEAPKESSQTEYVLEEFSQEERAGAEAVGAHAALVEGVGAEAATRIKVLGFDAAVQVVPLESHGQILHFGQTHESPREGWERVHTADKVRVYQDTLYEALSEVAASGIRAVFYEGVAENMDASREYMKNLEASLSDLAGTPIESVERAQHAIQALHAAERYGGHPFFRNAIPRSLVEEVREGLAVFRDAAPDGALGEVFQEQLHLSTAETMSGVLDDEMNSATLRLWMEGNVDLLSTETREVNEAAEQALLHLDEAMRSFKEYERTMYRSLGEPHIFGLRTLKTELANGSIDKAQYETQKEALKAEYREAKESLLTAIVVSEERVALREAEAAFAAVQRAREHAAISHIRAYQAEHPGESVVLVYGNDHDFADEVLEAREKSGDSFGMGLIKLLPGESPTEIPPIP